MEGQIGGAAVAGAERSTSLSGDEKNRAELKGCTPGIYHRRWSFHHRCLYREEKCLQFLVTYGMKAWGEGVK